MRISKKALTLVATQARLTSTQRRLAQQLKGSGQTSITILTRAGVTKGAAPKRARRLALLAAALRH